MARARADNIRVNVINPVAGETGMLADFMGRDTPEIRAKFVASIPLGRLSAVRHRDRRGLLRLDEAEFITGTCLRWTRRCV